MRLARPAPIGAHPLEAVELPDPTPGPGEILLRVASVVVAALRALDRGGTVAINAIHLDGIPAFSYDELWWERSLRSVANFTREDARELLALVATIPIRTSFDLHALDGANGALADLEAGRVGGAAVLDCR